MLPFDDSKLLIYDLSFWSKPWKKTEVFNYKLNINIQTNIDIEQVLHPGGNEAPGASVPTFLLAPNKLLALSVLPQYFNQSRRRKRAQLLQPHHGDFLLQIAPPLLRNQPPHFFFQSEVVLARAQDHFGDSETKLQKFQIKLKVEIHPEPIKSLIFSILLKSGKRSDLIGRFYLKFYNFT